MALPEVAPRAQRACLELEERQDGIYRVDGRSGRAQKLARDVIGGWSPSYAKPSAGLEPLLPQSREQIDLQIPVPGAFDEREISAKGRDDLARALLHEFGQGLFPVCDQSPPANLGTGGPPGSPRGLWCSS